MGTRIAWLLAGVLVAACGSDDGGGSGAGGSGGSSGSAGAGGSAGSSGSAGAGGGGTGGSAASGGAPAGCGDGTIANAEHCDDGANLNLDGCDLACRYELFMRVNAMEIQGGTAPSWCNQPANGLGTALTDLALGQVNDSLTSGIADGGTNILMQVLGLDDPAGVNDSTLDLGITSGEPDPAAGTWPANDPLDWSFLLQASTLDANGVPTARLPAAIASGALTAGPATISLALEISGSPAVLEILNAAARGRVGSATSVPSAPPAQLAAGFVAPETFAADQADEGLCGNVTVESLAKIAIPQALTEGVTACGDCNGSHAYTYCGDDMPVGPSCNSLLDALVGGCRVIACTTEVIAPTQPDVKNGGSALAVQGAENKVPSSQTDGNKDAYSAFFSFTAKRQHATGKL